MLVMVSAALGVVEFYHPAHSAPIAPFAAVSSRLAAGASMNAFGTSREVRISFALPGSDVEFPIEVSWRSVGADLRVGAVSRLAVGGTGPPGQRRRVCRADQARLLPPRDREGLGPSGHSRADARGDGAVQAASRVAC